MAALSEELREVLYRINVRARIDSQLLYQAFLQLLRMEDQQLRDVHLGCLLTGLMAKRPSASDVHALVQAVFDFADFSPRNRQTVALPANELLVGAVGSGKKGVKTMNITTPALIVAAACGAYVVKPVSKSTSSMTGSQDFLSQIGYSFPPQGDMQTRILKNRFAAFSIENVISDFDRIYGGRFFAPHALSFALPALASPIRFSTFLYGLAHPDIQLAVDSLEKFGERNFLVTTTRIDKLHYIDEMAPIGLVHWLGIKNGRSSAKLQVNAASELHFRGHNMFDIRQANDPFTNVRNVMDVFLRRSTPARRDTICLNASAILYLAQKCRNLKDGYELALESLEDGRALHKVIEIVEDGNGQMDKLRKFGFKC